MPRKPLTLFSNETKLLKEFGSRLRLARLRRKWSKLTVASRVGISRTTLDSAEDGASAVQIGIYIRILGVLQMQDDINLLAANDKLGQRLQDLGIDTPRRAPRRKSATTVEKPKEGVHHDE